MSDLVDIILPQDQQEGTESIVAKWLKKEGELVAQHEPILEISTDKVLVEISSPATGLLQRVLKNENEEVKPGDVLGVIAVGLSETSHSNGDIREKPQTASNQTAQKNSEAELSPAVRRLIKEHSLDPSKISGTGKGGRIKHEDVEKFLKSKTTGGAGSKAAAITGRKVPTSPMRRSVAAHMVQSLLHTAPHVTTVFDADLSNVVAHREKFKNDFELRGARLTFTAYFVKAAVEAIRAVPEANARWHEDTLELFDDCNIGIATALGQGGLIVPVIHKAQELDLFDIASRLQEITSNARDNRLLPSEVQNGTFTISNHGVSGSLIATPIIINQPQSAILGVGKLEKRPVAYEKDGEDKITVKPMIYVSLTIDHRVLDGHQANAFLTRFVEVLEHY